MARRPRRIRTGRDAADPLARTDAAQAGPTAERLAKGPAIVRVETIAAGITVPFNQEECLLDRLYRRASLGPPGGAAARRRLEAGLWLRRLYVETHDLAEGVWRYHEGGRDQSEMSDHQAWNHKRYLDTARALGPHWRTLEAACCLDRAPAARGAEALRRALDALADHRGM